MVIPYVDDGSWSRSWSWSMLMYSHSQPNNDAPAKNIFPTLVDVEPPYFNYGKYGYPPAGRFSMLDTVTVNVPNVSYVHVIDAP